MSIQGAEEQLDAKAKLVERTNLSSNVYKHRSNKMTLMKLKRELPDGSYQDEEGNPISFEEYEQRRKAIDTNAFEWP